MMENNNIFSINEMQTTKNIKEIFDAEAKDKDVVIQLKLKNKEIFELKFNLDSIDRPNQDINKIVGVTVEKLLNRVPILLTVQNEM
ncbi:hypothetical protein [Acinetobacter pollinis]|uniref:hypothetical protein n=1 Tax=Acinetobacter pollinis TaxID=2605270 RepID=UPI0018A2FB87|nr:hypothetical protein [Acinetobacter pollinis]MBF7689610.1 hypothetical protein [Acinetobacter pollinis]MBF7698229.1 hypothetical protein [Acinetobacter pollinis]